MNADSFKTLRTRLEASDRTLSEASFTDTVPQLLTVLGEADPELRDDLGWSTLSVYFRSALFPSKLRHSTLQQLMSQDFLFFKIQEANTVAAVKRSFSALTIANVVGGDIKTGAVLTTADLQEVTSNLCRYLAEEKDQRGFDPALGWVHSTAHTADALLAVSSHPNVSADDLQKSLTAITELLERRGFLVFTFGEDFRLGRALGNIFSKLPEENSVSFLQQRLPEQSLFETPARQNILSVLRCAYLELHWEGSTKATLMNEIAVRIGK